MMALKLKWRSITLIFVSSINPFISEGYGPPARPAPYVILRHPTSYAPGLYLDFRTSYYEQETPAAQLSEAGIVLSNGARWGFDFRKTSNFVKSGAMAANYFHALNRGNSIDMSSAPDLAAQIWGRGSEEPSAFDQVAQNFYRTQLDKTKSVLFPADEIEKMQPTLKIFYPDARYTNGATGSKDSLDILKTSRDNVVDSKVRLHAFGNSKSACAIALLRKSHDQVNKSFKFYLPSLKTLSLSHSEETSDSASNFSLEKLYFETKDQSYPSSTIIEMNQIYFAKDRKDSDGKLWYCDFHALRKNADRTLKSGTQLISVKINQNDDNALQWEISVDKDHGIYYRRSGF